METNINISGILIILLILTPFLIIFCTLFWEQFLWACKKELNLLILIQV